MLHYSPSPSPAPEKCRIKIVKCVKTDVKLISPDVFLWETSSGQKKDVGMI
jgi:hypothetical protein